MPKKTQSPREAARDALIASFKAIENSYFWKEYSKALQMQHDIALNIVRTQAGSATEAQLRAAAALCSAFHTALSIPTILQSNGPMGVMQEEQENTDAAEDE